MPRSNVLALASAILNSMSQPLLALGADLRIEVANDAFLHLFHVTRKETVGRPLHQLGNGQWDIPGLKRLLGNVLKHHHTFDDYEVEHEFENIGRRVILLSGRRLDPPLSFILLTIRDVTAQREAVRRVGIEAALRERQKCLAMELDDARLLQRISIQLATKQESQALYKQVVDTAQRLMRSDASSLQEYDSGNAKLRLLASSGFHRQSTEFWEWVEAGPGSVCGKALKSGERIIVADIGDFVADPRELEVFGRSKIMSAQSTPLVSRDRRIVGMLSTHWQRHYVPSDYELHLFDVLARLAADLLDRTQGAATLRESEERFRGIFENAATGIAITDLQGKFQLCNPAYTAMLGYTQEELRALDFSKVVHPDDVAANLAEYGRLVAHEIPSFEILNRYVRRNGEPLWVHKHVSLLRDAQGKPTNIIALITDMSERKRQEERIHLLLREVNHRSKNMLSLVQAIARQTAASEPSEFVQRFGERIQALAASQDLLIRSEWKGVPLNDLIRSQLAHFADLVDRRITLDGPSLTINAAAAQVLGMAVHELATNAGKYGALSNDDGRIEIAWQLPLDEPGPRFTMTWTESGGPPVTAPERRGFGSTVTTTIAKAALSAGVAVQYAPAGLVWALDADAGSILESGVPL